MSLDEDDTKETETTPQSKSSALVQLDIDAVRKVYFALAEIHRECEIRDEPDTDAIHDKAMEAHQAMTEALFMAAVRSASR